MGVVHDDDLTIVINEHEEIIDDILHQVLDPCGMFDQIASVKHVQNSVYSIISGNPSIWYS